MQSLKRLCLISLCLAPTVQFQAIAQAGPHTEQAASAVKPTPPVPAQKRIYLAPDDHTDYMWTGDEEDYRRVYVEMLDYYLDLADRTKDAPPDFRSKWNADGSLWIKTYEENTTPARFGRLIERIKDGTISFPLNTGVSTFGGTPMEAVLRDMYYAGKLERKYKFRVPLAMAMENQTLPFGLGALWAGAGAKYSWKGVCACLSEIDRDSPRPHEIYWWKGQDGSRILMKWNSRIGPGYGSQLGGYAEARFPEKEIGRVSSDPAFLGRYPYGIVGLFGKGSDDLKTLTDEFPRIARAMTTPDRRVIVSNMTDFFEDFERTYGADLPSQSVGFGNEWDLYSASMQELSSRVRRSVERLRPAEAMAALISLKHPDFMASRMAESQQTWTNLGLYWDHDWTADSTRVPRETRANWSRKLADQIETYVDRLNRDAAYRLGTMVKGEPGKRRFLVFNPLGWVRSDAADIAFESAAPVQVVDTETGKAVPWQYVTRSESGFPGGRTYLRIWGENLPAVGYRVFEIRNRAGPAFPAAATVATSSGPVSFQGAGGQTISLDVGTGTVLENSMYRLTVAKRGAITSWIDKRRGNLELAGSVNDGRWFINDLGNDPAGDLTVENAGPVSVTLKATGRSPLVHTSRITLYRDSRRVDLSNEITQRFDGTHTWGFVFNMTAPDVHHEEVGAIARAKLVADGGSYSPVMSRLDWLTLNHFVDMTGVSKTPGAGTVGVTLSNMDLAFMKLGKTAIHKFDPNLDTTTPFIQVLAGGQIDAPTAGIPNQGGDEHFLQRFAMQSHDGYDPVQAMRFSLEHQNPPVTEWVTGTDASLPPAQYSLLQNSNPDVLLWALKPAEDGPASGLIARVWNVTERPQDYTLSIDGGVATAVQTTHIETDLRPVPVKSGRATSTAAPSQIQTLRLMPREGHGQ